MSDRRTLFAFSAFFSIPLLAFLAAAQGGASKPPAPPPVPADVKKQFVAMMDKASAPTEKHKLLAALVGDFEQATEVRMGPGEPMRTHSFSTASWVMGGRFVRVESASAPDEEAKGERMNVYGYDPAAKKFTLWGIESFNLTAYSATGDYDEAKKEFVFDGERDAPTGGKSPFRWTLRLGEGGTILQTISMKTPNSKELVPVVTVKHTPRKK
jgi:hypothetical protein